MWHMALYKGPKYQDFLQWMHRGNPEHLGFIRSTILRFNQQNCYESLAASLSRLSNTQNDGLRAQTLWVETDEEASAQQISKRDGFILKASLEDTAIAAHGMRSSLLETWNTHASSFAMQIVLFGKMRCHHSKPKEKSSLT